MNYKYTLENNLLTKDQRDFYEKNGFLVIKNLVSSHELDQYYKRFLDICNNIVPIGQMTVMHDVNQISGKDSDRLVYKLQEFQADPVLSKYFENPNILKYVQCFVGKSVTAIHTMLINKPPDSGKKSSRHPIHQDLFYFPLRPADRIVCSWTAMEKINRHNGGLVVMPGTHNKELLPHQYPEWGGKLNKAFLGIVGLDQIKKEGVQLEYLEMEAGDTVFFHPLLCHGSGRNQTDHFRKAISCHYASSDCHFIDVVGTIQEVIKDEVDDIMKKKYPNIVANFEDIWRFKQVLVQGEEKSKL